MLIILLYRHLFIYKIYYAIFILFFYQQMGLPSFYLIKNDHIVAGL